MKVSKDKIEVNMNVYDIPILVEALEEANKEIERLHSIIKEVREYIEHAQNYGKEKVIYVNGKDILEILDKGVN